MQSLSVSQKFDCSLAIDGVEYIDTAALHSCVAAMKPGTRTPAAPRRRDLAYCGFDPDTLADTLPERNVESDGTAFSHVSPFV